MVRERLEFLREKARERERGGAAAFMTAALLGRARRRSEVLVAFLVALRGW